MTTRAAPKTILCPPAAAKILFVTITAFLTLGLAGCSDDKKDEEKRANRAEAKVQELERKLADAESRFQANSAEAAKLDGQLKTMEAAQRTCPEVDPQEMTDLSRDIQTAFFNNASAQSELETTVQESIQEIDQLKKELQEALKSGQQKSMDSQTKVNDLLTQLNMSQKKVEELGKLNQELQAQLEKQHEFMNSNFGILGLDEALASLPQEQEFYVLITYKDRVPNSFVPLVMERLMALHTGKEQPQILSIKGGDAPKEMEAPKESPTPDKPSEGSSEIPTGRAPTEGEPPSTLFSMIQNLKDWWYSAPVDEPQLAAAPTETPVRLTRPKRSRTETATTPEVSSGPSESEAEPAPSRKAPERLQLFKSLSEMVQGDDPEDVHLRVVLKTNAQNLQQFLRFVNEAASQLPNRGENLLLGVHPIVKSSVSSKVVLMSRKQGTDEPSELAKWSSSVQNVALPSQQNQIELFNPLTYISSEPKVCTALTVECLKALVASGALNGQEVEVQLNGDHKVKGTSRMVLLAALEDSVKRMKKEWSREVADKTAAVEQQPVIEDVVIRFHVDDLGRRADSYVMRAVAREVICRQPDGTQFTPPASPTLSVQNTTTNPDELMLIKTDESELEKRESIADAEIKLPPEQLKSTLDRIQLFERMIDVLR